MIQSFEDLTSCQRKLLDRLAEVGVDGSDLNVSARDFPVELMVASTAVVTSRLIELGLDTDGAAAFRITEHKSRVRLGNGIP